MTCTFSQFLVSFISLRNLLICHWPIGGVFEHFPIISYNIPFQTMMAKGIFELDTAGVEPVEQGGGGGQFGEEEVNTALVGHGSEC